MDFVELLKGLVEIGFVIATPITINIGKEKKKKGKEEED